MEKDEERVILPHALVNSSSAVDLDPVTYEGQIPPQLWSLGASPHRQIWTKKDDTK